MLKKSTETKACYPEGDSLKDVLMKFDETETVVRFQEIDAWGIAWHGHYAGWFEVGRMELLRKFGLMPLQFVEMGYISPIVKLTCDFKEPALCGDHIVIRSTIESPQKAALVFHFEVLRKQDRKLLAKGSTTQVLMTRDGTLLYYIPEEIKTKIDAILKYLMEL